jgi:hypothetical protein
VRQEALTCPLWTRLQGLLTLIAHTVRQAAICCADSFTVMIALPLMEEARCVQRISQNLLRHADL